MTPLAIVFMCTAVFSVVALAVWCYYKVLVGSESRQDKTPRDE